MIVVIPTLERNQLLNRTLDSLSASGDLQSLSRVVVAFNGSGQVDDSLEKEFHGRLPLEAQHYETPGKSRALNRVFEQYPDETAILFDDDIRVEPGSIAAFQHVWSDIGSARAFVCGAVEADYESAPKEWLRPYLPASVNGWKPWTEPTWFDVPEALGANISFRVADVLEAGGFSESRGPGTAARGQESEMQQRLLSDGFRGRYIPEAVVWHFVPKERCDPKWALDRAYQMGVGFGLEAAKHEDRARIVRRVLWRTCKREALRAIVACGGPFVGEKRRFHWSYRQMDYAGFTAGYRQGVKTAQ